MKAVINATPLIALALVNQLDVLYHLFEEVLVPPVVYGEVTNQGSYRPGAILVAQTSWIRVQSPVKPSNEIEKELVHEQHPTPYALSNV